MRGAGMALAVALLGLSAGAATAQNFNGAEYLARGDTAGAERVIVAQQGAVPRDADLQLNLAAVYARTGRTEAARRLYQAVLAQADEELDLAGRRTGMAHALAADGLRRLSTDIAAR